ncbi:hypothetical protein SAMN05216251_11432 [Actinacidiphila alni]|uniref:Uncharacterized protein n=1 Tax=Actinacidiphila alni TaxID=380248 RepID=A0A1I2IL86_9ACTN|nr:hypothetical protein [Actinacidiphila alni]SFF43162.1 hypothetical protein SAMN05216251_11432 [Actinacidiphila alni]
MGVESDRMVFDYLSRVGDLAQAALPASQRMRLVAQLRDDIDRERKGSDSPATVRRILGRIGSPDEVVEAAAGGTSPASAGLSDGPSPAATAGPYGPYAVPKTRAPGDGPARPDLDKPRAQGRGTGEWWQRGGPGDGRLRPGDELTGLPGMTGGVFIPLDDEELDDAGGPAKAPRRLPAAIEAAADEDDAGADDAYEEDVAAPRPRRRLLPRRGGPRTVAWAPLPLLAAGLLIVGAVIGSLIPLGLGWLTGYLSRQLTRKQAKFGILGIPGATAVGMIVWVWGRDAGKWGDPIAQGQMGQAFQDAYPATIRIAAVGSALYLLWRARRPA